MTIRLLKKAVSVATLALAGIVFAGCPCTNAVKVHNGTILPINEVHVKYQVQNDFGANLISSAIYPTETQTIGNLTPGRYDVELIFLGGGTATLHVDVLCNDSYTLDTNGTNS